MRDFLQISILPNISQPRLSRQTQNSSRRKNGKKREKKATGAAPNASAGERLVNFSPMLPKLLLTYPQREEEQGIAMASLFLKLLKVLANQLEIFVNLTFPPKV